MKYGLKQEILEQILDITRNYKQYKFKLFGSRARGDYKRTSDIDIAIFENVEKEDEYKIRNEFDLFDEMFNDPFFTRGENKLMKTDIKEKGDKYLLEVDLPGYEKEDIKIEVDNGYLIVNAKTSHHKDEKEEGKYVRKERFVGECSRSFYVGEDVRQDDIKASFKNGTLKIEIPKKDEPEELPEKKYIPIDD